MKEGERSIISQWWQKYTTRATTRFKTQSQVRKCFTAAGCPLSLNSTGGEANSNPTSVVSLVAPQGLESFHTTSILVGVNR